MQLHFERNLRWAGKFFRAAWLMAFLVLGVLSAQSVAVEESVWHRFLSWAQALPPDGFSLKSSLDKYRAHLVQSGLSAAAIEKQIDELAQLLKGAHTGTLPQQNVWDRLMADKFYARRPPAQTYPFPPNAFIASVIKDLPPGKSLDCGMGSGRDVIYLAQKGWDATGFDRSSGGVALALENAHKAGVKINAMASDAAEFDWGDERFDLISNIHSFGLHESLSRIRTALKTGGIYVVELSMLPEMRVRALYPVSYLPNEPLGFFREGWRILRYEDVAGPWDCAGCVNNPKSRVFRMVAQKIKPADWR